MVTGCAGLKDGFVLERPRSGGINPPSLQAREQGGDGAEILAMIRPEIQAGTLPCPVGNGFKKAGLQQAVFVVTFFWPRIGKQDPDLGQGDEVWQRIDQLPGFSLEEMAVGEPGSRGLSFGSLNALADQVHPEAKGLSKFPGVAREKMAVPGADLQSNGGRGGNDRGQLGPQRGPALGDMLDEFRFGSHEPL